MLGTGTLTIQNNGDILTDRTHIGFNAGVTGTATITGAGSSLTAVEVFVGSSGTGTMNINSSGHVDVGTDAWVGNLAGSSGTANVDGLNSQWNISGKLMVGNQGPGSLNITSAGQVSSRGATFGSLAGITGNVSVSGTNSKWTNTGDVVFGDHGAATISISAGGQIQSSRDSILSNQTDGTATATVSGANSRWGTTRNLWVGKSNAASLRIEAGGTVAAESTIVGGGGASPSVVVVTGSGSTLSNTGALNIGLSKSASLTIDSGAHVSAINSNLGISDMSMGTATITGATSTWDSGLLNVGLGGNGFLSIESGAQVSSAGGSVGATIGSSGTATVTGSTSAWTINGDFSVGGQGTGQLTITAGGKLVQSSGNLVVGDFGAGKLVITAGGQVTGADTGDLGNEAGSTGEISLSGANSRLAIANRFNIGTSGRGVLTVANGASVSNGIGIIRGAHSIATVQGAGSTWTNTGILNLFDDAQLLIQAGGSVSSVNSNIGAGSSATSRVTVTGIGSNWNIQGTLSVAVGDGGTLDIQNGGSVVVTGPTDLYPGSLLKLEGGALSTSEIAFHSGGTFDWTSGTLHVGNYPTNLSTPNGGVLAPGNSAGETVIQGNYDQSRSGATLAIEVGGAAQFTQYDSVTVANAAALGGNLQLSLLNGFVPSPADTFTILQASLVTGAFANAANGQRLATSDGLGSFIVNYGSGSAFNSRLVVLSAFLATILPGDYNQNGIVDAADYTVWRDHLGSPTSLANDNTPGVGPDDYIRWKTNFGQHSGSGAGASAIAQVPEPISTVPLVCVALGWSRRRHRAP